MAYSSLASILLVVPGLPQTTSSAGYSETSVVVSRHITRADALIDSKISKRYSTPISPTPPLLASLSEDIVVYYSYRSFYTQDNSNKTDYFNELRDGALKVLDEIREGKIDIVNTAGSLIEERSDEATSGVLDSTNKDYQPFFDVDDEFDWHFDSDLLDDIAGNR